MLSATTPWALLLLALLPLSMVMGRQRLRRLPGRRGVLALTLRLLTLALLVASLSGLQFRTLGSQVADIFLVDASASLGAVGQQQGMAWATQAVAAGGAHDQAGLVLYGSAPRLAIPLAHYARLPDPASDPASQSNIAAALHLALALLPTHSTARITVLSDGQVTTGDTDGALALAVAHGVTIDTVAITPSIRRDVAVRAVTMPPTVRSGDRVPLRITLYSTTRTNALLRLSIDGQEVQQTVTVPQGTTQLATEQRFDRIGPHTVQVTVAAPGDTVPQNDTLSAVTVVAPQGRVLLVTQDGATGNLPAALRQAHLSLASLTPERLPASASGYRNAESVVLDNVSSALLSGAQQAALRDAVHDQGLGLTVIGGNNAFSDGGYAHSTLEQTLPLQSISSRRNVSAPIALMLVIDKSGSMSDQVDGVAKIDMVKVAATSALDRLADGDAVGVVAFDDVNHWIVPFHVLQGPADKTQIRKQIATLGADGDTYIYPALQQAEQAVLTVPTVYRHIVLLTDGQGEDAPFETLIRRLRREHITLSTIGVGQDVVQDELRRWARLGAGIFHYVSDPHEIPRIIVNETRYGTGGGGELHGHIHLGVAAASPLLRSLADQTLPDLAAFNATLPKTSAQVVVQAASGDPLLGSWQYGLGRVVAWTSDDGAIWAPHWSATQHPTFWSDLVRWSLRGYTPRTTLPRLTEENGTLHLALTQQTNNGAFNDSASPRVRLTLPDGTAQLVPLTLSGPGLYTADLPFGTPGVYIAAPVHGDRRASPADIGALAVPYPSEYDDSGVDRAMLTHLAETTNGRMLTDPRDAFSHDSVPDTVFWLPLWPWLLSLALLLLLSDIAVRLLVPREAVYAGYRH